MSQGVSGDEVLSGRGDEEAEPSAECARGLCTGKGPVWAEPGGTGSVWAGTSCWLQPEAPGQRLTDASTWS